MAGKLDEILAAAGRRAEPLRARRAELARTAAAAPARASFVGALRRETISLIAEVKRRSPSAGTISETLDPAAHAAAYAAAGAAAVSVLTEPDHFGGSLADLRAVAARVTVPLLRKDFIVEEAQLFEARSAGASAVLLIARVLDGVRLRALVAAAAEVGLDALVEVHDARELDRALASGAAVVGVNSRNLDTFAIDTEAAWALLERIPPDRIRVAESGMSSAADVAAAAAGGADAVLIGSALSAAADPGALVRRLTGLPRAG